MKVVENHIWFPVVHSFDVETFEFSVPAEFVVMTWSVYKIFLSSKCGVSFYWGPAWAIFDSSLFWNCKSKTDSTFNTEKLKQKQLWSGNFKF